MISLVESITAMNSNSDAGAAQSTPLICAKDLYEVPRLTVQALLAWTLPEPFWWPLSRFFGRLFAAAHPARTRSNAELIRSALLDTPLADRSQRIATEYWANRYQERFQCLRTWSPGGWNPEIDVTGMEHVEAASTNGRGILFWSGKFAFSALVNKIALHRLNMEVTHFSRPYHGFSTTRFGIRYLNAVRRGAEDRYLLERLMTPEHRTREALELIRDRLVGKGTASFTIGDKGRHRASAKFLATRIQLATGPLAIARRAGAVVLPVFTLRTAPGRFTAAIGPAIESRVNADGNVDFADGIQTLIDLIVPYVMRDPGQWRGWPYLVIGPNAKSI